MFNDVESFTCVLSTEKNPQVTYESVEDVHLTDPNSVYFNVGLESESETSEVLSLPGSSEEVARWGPLNIMLRLSILLHFFDVK